MNIDTGAIRGLEDLSTAQRKSGRWVTLPKQPEHTKWNPPGTKWRRRSLLMLRTALRHLGFDPESIDEGVRAALRAAAASSARRAT